MPHHKNKFTDCVVNRGRPALRIALWLLVPLVWVSTAKSQEPRAQPVFAVVETNSPTPAKASAPASDLADPPSAAADLPVEAMFPHLSDTRFWLSGQANFIFQTNPPFHASYSGKHSLGPNYEKALSRVMTLYTGLRLNNSTELLVDIEDAAGGGLSNALGLGGITNLDVVRIPGEGSPLSTAPYLARGMIHKVFALSKDKIENDRNALSLFDELPRRRLEVRFGKFGLADFFDQNSVGTDSHFQFTNWTIDQTGAWDFAADTRGYTVGVTADYEDRNWGFRFAEALMPKVANGIDLVWKPWQAHAEKLAIRTASWPDFEETRSDPFAGVHELRQHGGLSRRGYSIRRRFGSKTRHHQPSLAYHAQVWVRHQCGAKPDAQSDGLRTFWMEQRQDGIIRFHRSRPDLRRRSGCKRCPVASSLTTVRGWRW